jgi:HSP20 family molecular chaperone IbpA
MLAPYFGFRGLLDSFDNTAPYAQVRETNKAAILELEVPRYTAQELSIEADPNTGRLVVSGRRSGDRSFLEDEDDNDGFGALLFASSPLSSFRKAFHFSPRHYDLTNVSSVLKDGVFKIKVPKLPEPEQPKPVTVFGGSASSTAVVARTTPDEFAALREAKWPPSIKVQETDKAVQYQCVLPPAVTSDHIELSLQEGVGLMLSVTYIRHEKSEHREESQSMSFSTNMAVPPGTKPEDIHTEYKDGLLTVQLEKHPNPTQSVKVRKHEAIEGGKK